MCTYKQIIGSSQISLLFSPSFKCQCILIKSTIAIFVKISISKKSFIGSLNLPCSTFHCRCSIEGTLWLWSAWVPTVCSSSQLDHLLSLSNMPSTESIDFDHLFKNIRYLLLPLNFFVVLLSGRNIFTSLHHLLPVQ